MKIEKKNKLTTLMEEERGGGEEGRMGGRAEERMDGGDETRNRHATAKGDKAKQHECRKQIHVKMATIST